MKILVNWHLSINVNQHLDAEQHHLDNCKLQHLTCQSIENMLDLSDGNENIKNMQIMLKLWE